MRVIGSNEVRMTPMHCAVAPTIGQTSGHRFIDTGHDMYVNSVNTPNRVYVSEPAVGEMARMFGWVSPADAHALEARGEALMARVAELEGALATAERQLEAVQVLKNSGFTQTRPPGRPRKVAA